MGLTQLVVLGTVAILSIAGSACTREQPIEKTDKVPTPILSAPPGSNVPKPSLDARAELGWVLNDGKRATLADYRGKVLVLDFYATWCAPCRQSIPRLSALRQKYGLKGVEVVGLNVGGPDDRIKVANFAKELNIQYPLGFPDKALTDLFLSDNQTIPQTFVLKRDGRLQKRFIGYEETSGTELEKVIGETANAID
jgi:thiol-disulfide isomerase/thioredoxin